MQSVFFYGLFMDPGVLREKGLSLGDPIRAFVDGYGLRIGERATLIASPNEKAYGQLLTLPEKSLQTLYRAKDLVDYQPVKVIAQDFDNKVHEAVSYNLPAEKLTGKNVLYAKSLAAIAKKIDLPAIYVEEILEWTRKI